MNKNLLIGIGIVVALLAIGLLAFGVLTNSGKEQAINEAQEQNEMFHTVPEGGECRPAMGDCMTGLTCGEDLKCIKP